MTWTALRVALACIVGLLLVAPDARAHTPLVSVLSLEERGRGEFLVELERSQGIEDASAAYELLKPVFPEHCRFTPPRLACGTRGLDGRIGFEGLANLSSSGVIRLHFLDGRVQTLNLTPAQPDLRISSGERESAGARFVAGFVWVGMTHIWLGIDHLLFVLGVFWLLDSRRALLAAVTAFTVGHSSTLAAATLGFYGPPAAPVEAAIALSIAFVAVEIVDERRMRAPSATRRYPWLVALAFGLLHGFGFASALSELRVAAPELPLALLGFNAGVELGQLVFIAALSAIRPLILRLDRPIGSRLATAGVYAMGGLSMYWFFERVTQFGTAG